MREIWKFPFELQEFFTIPMPENTEILTVQMQKNVPCIWAFVVPGIAKEKRNFRLLGTGHKVALNECNSGYIGTIQTHDETFVWHLFEVV